MTAPRAATTAPDPGADLDAIVAAELDRPVLVVEPALVAVLAPLDRVAWLVASRYGLLRVARCRLPDGYLGVTAHRDGDAIVLLSDEITDPGQVLDVFAHELGHLLDPEYRAHQLVDETFADELGAVLRAVADLTGRSR